MVSTTLASESFHLRVTLGVSLGFACRTPLKVCISMFGVGCCSGGGCWLLWLRLLYGLRLRLWLLIRIVSFRLGVGGRWVQTLDLGACGLGFWLVWPVGLEG